MVSSRVGKSREFQRSWLAIPCDGIDNDSTMTRAKTSLVRLSELLPNQAGDFFALLAERKRAATGAGKVYYHCRFRDLRRSVSVMVWSDAPLFAECDSKWQAGQFYKIRGTYVEHERYGPQMEIERIRPVQESDAEAGFTPL